MKAPLDVSKGKLIDFAANGVPMSGTVLGAKIETTVVAIVVETATEPPENAQLTLPDFPEIGGCWQAHPQRSPNGFVIVIKVPIKLVDLPSVGK
jgi:hypothetical protein